MKFTKQQLDNIILEEMSRVISEQETSLLSLLGSVTNAYEIQDIIQKASDGALFGPQTAKGEEGWQDPIIAGMTLDSSGRFVKLGPTGLSLTPLASFIIQQVQQERDYRTELMAKYDMDQPIEEPNKPEIKVVDTPPPPKPQPRATPSREDIIAAAGDMGTKPEGEIPSFTNPPSPASAGAKTGADTGALAQGDYTLADYEASLGLDTATPTAADEPSDESGKTIREHFQRFLK